MVLLSDKTYQVSHAEPAFRGNYAEIRSGPLRLHTLYLPYRGRLGTLAFR